MNETPSSRPFPFHFLSGCGSLAMMVVGCIASAAAFDRYQEWSYATSSSGYHLAFLADSFRSQMLGAGACALVALGVAAAGAIGTVVLLSRRRAG